MKIKKKVVLFDLDDTLYDYKTNHQESLNQVYKVLNKEIKISKKEFLDLYKLSNKEVKVELIWTASSHNRILYYQRLVEKLCNTINSDLILKLYNTYWDSFLGNIKLWKWVLDTLKKIKGKWLQIWIITDLTTNIQLRKISKLWLNGYIDVLVTSEEAWIEKPSQSIFLLTLNKLNSIPSEAIMIWDSLKKDIEGWNLLWIDTVLITDIDENEFVFNQNYEEPNYIIKEIPEILRLL